MDGVTLTVLSSVLGSQFYLIYKVGKLEGELKELRKNLVNK